MRPMRAEQIGGVWGTLLLPLAADESIDWLRLDTQLTALISGGVQGVYAHGTAGEFHTIGEPEFDRVNELLAERCTRAGVPYQIGAGHPSAQTCLDRVRRARELAPGAIQVILPDWLPLSDAECTAFLRRVAAVAEPVPIVLYNPPHAKTQVSPELLGRLLDRIPALVGVKMAGGDGAWYARIRRHAPRCSVFVAGHRLATGLANGAHGSYSNIAAMTPAGAVEWYGLMGRDMPAALDLERRIGVLFSRHVAPLQARGLSNPALDKFLAAVGGWTDTGLRVRWPYASVPPDSVEAARRDARDLVPELFTAPPAQDAAPPGRCSGPPGG
ncbi:dihydrodipicolinate synthase family protein [Phytoactinopolyspora halotolerans]|uniref:Dihydrodipicolinate synthase family protein n=1 Tax=Phytoactinopolyspora halotolerans TaxID=1981512 RepID=A0A6L9S280_9ACTN|nr:dihydrodipicolinate synthase family protein [Phytoactinopolyspora halotolerans]NED98890.1 dihydrodipicolinate synthase family protein [Phytoactinopolyspora halotolerans]